MLVFIIIFLSLAVDRLTKIWAIKDLAYGKDVEVIKGFFSFSYLENRGAAFGIFQNKLMFLSAITFIVVALMIGYIIVYRPKSILLKTSLALIISGALGNLYDRIMYKYVVDFIVWHYKDKYYWPTFNMADVFVVVGTFLLAICIIKEDSNGK